MLNSSLKNESLKKTKRTKKRAIIKSKCNNEILQCVFWNVNGKKTFLNQLESQTDDPLLTHSQVVFLSETWQIHPNASFLRKDFFFSDAQKTTGRPSGGLEMYLEPSLKGNLISKSSRHICIETSKFYIIGVYYKPTLELDEIISDLLTALKCCSNTALGILVGGDFNIKFDSFEFQSLLKMLNSIDLHLCTNPNTITFVGNRSESTPDYAFCSSNLKIVNSSVPRRPESDHFPVVVSVGKENSQPNPNCKKQNHEKVFDYALCSHLLEALTVPKDLHIEELAQKIHGILSASHVLFNSKPTKRDKLWHLRRDANEALDLYNRYKSPFLRSYYLQCRRALQRETLLMKRRKNEAKISKLLKETEEQGIRALYKQTRTRPDNLSSHVPLHTWVQHFVSLYQAHKQPQFFEIPVVPSQRGLDLLCEFSAQEVEIAIAHQTSSAKGVNNISPKEIKPIAKELSPWLVEIFNYCLKNSSSLPQCWMSIIFFFTHKKGTFNDPSNYRSLAIEDPVLKIFMTCLYNRLAPFSESTGLLPPFQFGFRKHHSTIGAAALLKKCAETTLKAKQKLFTCFVDFKKAFDLVDRTLLCEKLQLMGIPTEFVSLIFNLLMNQKYVIRSNQSLSEVIQPLNGVPQGDPLSPLLFSLFLGDLPEKFSQEGIQIGTTEVKYILYADDLVMLTTKENHLQHAINVLSRYCDNNRITVSIEKTKCMTFYKGTHSTRSFKYKNCVLENCNTFTYLGIVFTTRLSSSKHVNSIVAKANSKIGYLFSTIPLKSIPLSVALNIFDVYVLPIFTYGLPIWLPKLTESAKSKLNSLYTKFIKRYLGLPYLTNNAIVHFISNTVPLSQHLNQFAHKTFFKLRLPEVLSGTKLEPPNELETLYNAIHKIPTDFWLSPPIEGPLPVLPEPRRALLYDVIDLHHHNLCKDRRFHLDIKDACICQLCGNALTKYHYRECPELCFLSPCARLKKACTTTQ